MSRLDVAKMIRDDCATDTEELEGKWLTGHLLAEQFGIIRAQIAALASILIEMEEEKETVVEPVSAPHGADRR